MTSNSTKRVEPVHETALAFPKEHPRSEEVSEALTRARVAENLVDLYDAWHRLTAARAAAAEERAREAERLDVRAEYVLRTLETARSVSVGLPQPAEDGVAHSIDKSDPLAEFQREAEAELKTARLLLDDRASGEEALFEGELTRIRAAIKAKADTILAGYQPKLRVRVQPVGREHSLVHVERPDGDDAVLLQYLLTGRLFTRYDAFFDDSVEDLSLGPARFYPDEGLEKVWFESVDEEDALLADEGGLFVPLKGLIAFGIPGHAFPRFRIVNHGPLSEIEARTEGTAYQHLVPRAAAELLSAYLLRLKVARKLDVVLSVV